MRVSCSAAQAIVLAATAVVVAIEPGAEQPHQAELLHHAEVTRVTRDLSDTCSVPGTPDPMALAL